MLSVLGDRYAKCDGTSRRGFLQAGVLGLTGLTMADVLRSRAAQAASGKPVKDTSVILIWKGGGPSHLDTWDLKPAAPAEFRGDFQPIASSVPGIDVCELLPQSAAQMDKFAIVRSVTHPDAGHESASHYLLTGYKPTNDIPSNEMPSYGSVTAKERGPRRPGLPAYVALPQAPRSSAAAYLGVAYNPFSVGADPSQNNFSVRNLTLPNGLSLSRLDSRRALLKSIDTLRRESDQSGLMEGLDAFTQKAFEMVTSPAAQRAFALDREDAELRDRYGRNKMGQSLLLARRLVEAGVTFVTVDAGGWDTHANNFESLRKKLPEFDQGWGTLMADMAARGLLENTLVLVWGEFGRTPRINTNAGRDHWPGAMSVVLAGGGLQMGQAIGQSDAKAEYPKERPLVPEDILSTMYHVLGIDQEKEYYNDAERPIKILGTGSPIKELVG
ncbi:MAG TPA: DUF1501 domain-containing protein [Pirellulales bacterium]|jgi:hypothetical protein|nr:DUF1501 domain-containing protein [Pirellulales bacterium]